MDMTGEEGPPFEEAMEMEPSEEGDLSEEVQVEEASHLTTFQKDVCSSLHDAGQESTLLSMRYQLR